MSLPFKISTQYDHLSFAIFNCAGVMKVAKPKAEKSTPAPKKTPKSATRPGSKPGEKTIYKCKICSAAFTEERSVKAHLITQHEDSLKDYRAMLDEGKKEFPCKTCSKLFTEEKNLKTHIGTVFFTLSVTNILNNAEISSK